MKKVQKIARARIKKRMNRVKPKRKARLRRMMKTLDEIQTQSSVYKIPMNTMARFLKRVLKWKEKDFIEALAEDCAEFRLSKEAIILRILIVATYADLKGRNKQAWLKAVHLVKTGKSNGRIHNQAKKILIEH